MQLKSRLLIKPTKVNPRFCELIQAVCSQLQSLVSERDERIEESIESLAEAKFKLNLDLKKKYNLKIALAKKQPGGDFESLESELKEECKRVDKEQQEKSAAERLEIKAEFNLKGRDVQIDVDKVIECLLRPTTTTVAAAEAKSPDDVVADSDAQDEATTVQIDN